MRHVFKINSVVDAKDKTIIETTRTKESEAIVKDIFDELDKLSLACVDEIENRQFSRTSKLPFKLATFVYALSWRMKECGEAALKLIECGYIHSSLMLIRSSLENAFILYYTRKLVEETVEADSLPKETDGKLMSLLFANKYWEGERSEYDVKYRAETVKYYYDIMAKEYPEVAKYYHYLCEFVHTNSDGVGQSFSLLDEKLDKTYFGPQLNDGHALFPAFVITLKLALHLFNNQVHYIDDYFDEFINKCEEDIVRKTAIITYIKIWCCRCALASPAPRR